MRLVFWACSAALSSAAPVKDQFVSAELVAEVSAIQPGVPFQVAVRLEHDEHWHTYWINDGDSGLPTKIRWELPEGFSAGPIQWPYPQRIEMPPLVSYGFENEAWLLVEITPPEKLDSTTITLTGKISWLMCKEVCIPGRANVSLTLPVADAPVLNNALADAFSKARTKIPSEETDWRITAEMDASTITLLARPPVAMERMPDVQFFPVDKEVVATHGPFAWEKSADGFVLKLPRDTSATTPPGFLRAVLVGQPTLARQPDHPALLIQVPLSEAKTSSLVAPPAASRGLLVVSLFAFIGGMILNLMPCVFPVISLKILGFVKQAGEDPKVVWHHGLVFAAGVMVSFWILAILLLVLRAGGAGIGWGFQLQSPHILALLSLLFFVLALNLFGVFELGLSLTAAGGSALQKQGWAGSFFSGFLATVIATPCTAPFMGVALGYALTQPPYVALVVFSALAFGMAFPYLVLSRFPALLKKLPRPGAWMETMKQIMGFFLLATVLWLIWVLSALVASATIIWLLGAFLLSGIGVWILGKWDALSRSTSVRWRGRVAGLALLALAVLISWRNIEAADHSTTEENTEWQAFSPERLNELLQEGRPVFIDFTAKWCLTCQVNKLTVLRTAEVMDAMREKSVALMVADWTDENEMIARELARHGRQSVPLYLLYPGGGNTTPQLLPEILTRKIVLDALNKLN